MRIAKRTPLFLLIALAAWSTDGQAQDRLGLQVAVGGGWQAPSAGSALEPGATIGGELTYFVRPALGVGIWTNYTFTETDGSKFAPAALSFVDSTTFTIVSQPLDMWEYGVHAKLRFGDRLSPYLTAGAGGYTVFFDPQQVGAQDTDSGLLLRFGAGLDLYVTEAMGFQLSVTDAFYPDWDTNALNPVEDRFRNQSFPELNPDADELDEVVHNIRFTAAISVRPGG